MSLRNAFGLFVVVVCFAACAAPQPPAEPAVDIVAEEQAIQDASMAWLAAVMARDEAAVDSYLAADITMMSDGEVLEGLPAVQMNRDEEWAENPDFTVSWTPDDIGVAASGDLGYEHGIWNYDPDGDGEMMENYGQYVTVWKKIDGRWKAIYDAGTTVESEEEMLEE